MPVFFSMKRVIYILDENEFHIKYSAEAASA